MIYDCSLFYNELDLLEIRLHELDSVVDKFVIIEGTKPFYGSEKPLIFQDNKNSEIFKPFLDKIIHIIVTDMPHEEGFKRENFLFNRGLDEALSKCNDDDIIMISYGDEITRVSTLEDVVKDLDKCYVFSESHCHVFFNWVFKDNYRDFPGTRIARYKFVKEFGKERYDRFRWHLTTYPRIENGGWHASYFSGLDRIIDKFKTFSHAPIYNHGQYVDKTLLKDCIKNKICIINSKAKIEIVPINEETTPKYVLENKDKFWYMLWEEGIEERL